MYIPLDVNVMDTLNQYVIQRITENHIGHIVSLYQAAFKRKVTEDFIRKKFDTSSFGVKNIGFIALTKEGHPAAFYGVLPCSFILHGKEVLAAQSGDTMTHPEHQRKGLFMELSSRTFALAKENGIRFLFGFPNQHSLPGSRKLNWQYLPDTLQCFQLDVPTLGVARFVRKTKYLMPLYEKYAVKIMNPNLAGAETQVLPPSGSGVNRNTAFVRYKAYHKSYHLSMDKESVWCKIDGELKIGFVSFAGDMPDATFLKKIKRMGALLGCRRVLFMTSKGSSLYDFLVQYLKPANGFPVAIYPLQDGEMHLDDLKFEYCDLDIF